jgi:hypothetical protein
MGERRTLCDLELVTLEFGWSDAKTCEPGYTFRLTFRHRDGQLTGRINVDHAEVEQFTTELEAVLAAIVAKLRSPSLRPPDAG